MSIEKNITYEYSGEYQSAIKRIATYLTGNSAEDPGYSSMEIIANKMIDRVDAEAPEFASPMDAIAWSIENGALDGEGSGGGDIGDDTVTVTLWEGDVTLEGHEESVMGDTFTVYSAEVGDVDLTMSSYDMVMITMDSYGECKSVAEETEVDSSPAYLIYITFENPEVEGLYHYGQMSYVPTTKTLFISFGGSGDNADYSGEQHLKVKVVHCDEY